MTGAAFAALIDDLDAALDELTAPVRRDPGLWNRGRPGKWTGGQQVDHIRLVLVESARDYGERAQLLRSGTLPAVPPRGLLERLWVALVIAPGRLPRGGKTQTRFEAQPTPPPEATLAGLAEATRRHRTLGASLTPEQRDRLWVPNPFVPRWRYTFSEILRVHAVHARHHAKQVLEIDAA